MQHPDIVEVVRRDRRYPYEAYEFLFQALAHTQKLNGRAPDAADEPRPGTDRHVSGRELLDGVCDLARREFGLLAPDVFHAWGVRRTDDVGELVFNLIEAQLLSKTDRDDRADFRDAFDLDRVLADGVTIPLEECPWAKRSR